MWFTVEQKRNLGQTNVEVGDGQAREREREERVQYHGNGEREGRNWHSLGHRRFTGMM
jgi:hypothetical protein